MDNEKMKEIISLLKNIKAQQKEIMSFEEAYNYLDISDSLLYKMTSTNVIKFSKPKGKLYFKKSDLDNWMQQNTNITVSDIGSQVANHLKGNQYGK